MRKQKILEKRRAKKSGVLSYHWAIGIHSFLVNAFVKITKWMLELSVPAKVWSEPKCDIFLPIHGNTFKGLKFVS